MNNDNYYHSSYSTSGGMKPDSGPYNRSRIGHPGSASSGNASMLHSIYPGSKSHDHLSDEIAYGNRVADGPHPTRKMGLDVHPPTSMVRDYQSPIDSYSYEGNGSKKVSYSPSNKQTENNPNMNEYSGRVSYDSKYDFLSAGSGNVRHQTGGFGNEERSVSKIQSSYSSDEPGISQSSRDSFMPYERERSREMDPPSMRDRGSVMSTSLDKYYTSEEIKRFNEYNRCLIMSSPGRQKKFYASLSLEEYTRFQDYIQLENSKKRSMVSVASPPPIPSVPMKNSNVPPPPPIPNPYGPSFSSSYSFSSFYDDDKLAQMSSKSRIDQAILQRHLSNSKKPSSSPHPYMKSSYDYLDTVYGQEMDIDIGPMSRYTEFEMSRRSPSPLSSRDLSFRKYRYRSDSRSRSRSPSRSYSSRSRSPLYSRRSPPGSASHYRSYERRDERGDERRDNRRSRENLSVRPNPKSPKKAPPASNSRNNIKLDPEQEYHYLINSLDKIKKIYKIKLDELEEIKKKEKEDSYLYKKASRSVKDVEKTINIMEKRIELNREKVSGSAGEKGKQANDKKKPIKSSSSSTPKTPEKGKMNETQVKKSETKSNENVADVEAMEIEVDNSINLTVSSTNVIPATQENVAKLPKIPKISKKVESKEVVEDKNDKSKKEEHVSTKNVKEISPKKSSANKETEENKKEKLSEKSTPVAKGVIGAVTEDEIDKIMPHFQWCCLCKNFFETPDEFMSHLHRETHMSGLRSSDFAIIKRAEEKFDTQTFNEMKKQNDQPKVVESESANVPNSDDPSNSDETNQIPVGFLGTEFLYPSKAFYCDLCAKFMCTTVQTELHLRSEKHIALYKKYLQKNNEYEIKMTQQRKNTFKSSHLLRSLVRMKDKGEDIVSRVNQASLQRKREKDQERLKANKSNSSTKKRVKTSSVSQPGSSEVETIMTNLLEKVQTDPSNNQIDIQQTKESNQKSELNDENSLSAQNVEDSINTPIMDTSDQFVKKQIKKANNDIEMTQNNQILNGSKNLVQKENGDSSDTIIENEQPEEEFDEEFEIVDLGNDSSELRELLNLTDMEYNQLTNEGQNLSSSNGGPDLENVKTVDEDEQEEECFDVIDEA